MGSKNKIKVLYTIPNFDTAGSGKVVHDLVKGLDKDQFEVEIACSSNRGALFKEMESLGVPIHIVKTTTNYRPYISLPSRIKTISKFLVKKNYDIVHSWHWSSDWTEALASRLVNAKWIYTKKAMSWGNQHWKIRSFLANYIITINDDMRAYFSYKRNQKLIPLGLDTNYYSSEPFAQEIQLKEDFEIITVANLVPVKGIEVLIKAISILQNDKVILKVLGDDKTSYGNYLRTLVCELNLETQVQFLGKKADVRPFIAQSDLYVIPTLDEGRKEGMPMALVEAMSMGIPVLGADISGIKYVLKDFDDLLFKAGDPICLSQAINKIRGVSIEERKKLGDDLRKYVLNNFSYDAFINAHQELYIHLINKST